MSSTRMTAPMSERIDVRTLATTYSFIGSTR